MHHPSSRKKAEDKEVTHAVSRDTSNTLVTPQSRIPGTAFVIA